MDRLEQERAYTVPVDYNSLSLLDIEVCRYMGYGSHEPDPGIVGLIHAMKQEVAEVCKPCFGYRPVYGRRLNNQSLELSGMPVSPGRIITGYLKESDFFLLLVATAGLGYDQWRARIDRERDIVHQYVADTLGSAIVEAVVARALDELESIAVGSGLHTSNSYSPGYCGWHVNEQQILFSLLPEGFCGVTLTKSSLMLPVKSVSAVIGIGKNVVRQPYGCAICKKKDCFKRRLSHTEQRR